MGVFARPPAAAATAKGFVPGWKGQVQRPQVAEAAASRRRARVLAGLGGAGPGRAVNQPAALGESRSAAHSAARPRLPLSGFCFEAGSAPGRAFPPSLRDQGLGQLPEITLRVTFSKTIFPAIDLKEVGPDILTVTRSFLCNTYLCVL